MDIDEYDIDSDHLIIIDKKSNEVVGTFRLRSSRFVDRFYSESEFEMQEFKDIPGEKLELGRACIDPQYRKGTVISLIWRGIAEYLNKTASDILFGCSSVHVTHEEFTAFRIFLEKEGVLSDQYSVRPKESFDARKYGFSTTTKLAPEVVDSEPKIPPLFAFYLRAGATFSPWVAFDQAFDCIDFFTVLKIKDLTESLSRKYTHQ